jgi:hypothetical protein
MHDVGTRLDMREQIMKRHACPVRRRHLDLPWQERSARPHLRRTRERLFP